jgi:serine/threonine protein kinase
LTAKIADFGLSTELHSDVANDQLNEVTGTMLYMAPE